MKLRLQTPTHRCRWAAATALAVAVAGSPLGLAGAAHAAGSGEVDVFVRDASTWAGVPGQTVTLYSTATGAVVGTSRVTDSYGEVGFPGLGNGSYTAKVAGSSKYHEGYTTVVTLTSSDDFAFTGVRLHSVTPSYGRLEGDVTKAKATRLDTDIEIFPATATNASIASGAVQPVYEISGSYGSYGEGDALDTAWKANLEPGQYKVLVADDDTPQTTWHDAYASSYDGYDGYDSGVGWWEHASQVWVGSGASNDADHAKTFTVTAAKATTTGPVALAPGADTTAPARISGTVTNGTGGRVGDVDVLLFQQQADESWQPIALQETEKDGTFGFSDTYDYDTGTTTPLPAGTYTVAFTDPRREYGTEFLGDVHTEDYYEPPTGAATLTLGASDTQTADASLSALPIDRSSGAFGTVTDDTGKAHAGYVTIYDAYGNAESNLPTRRDGTWSVPATDLAPGRYRVSAGDEVDVDGWYGGAKTFKTAATYTVPVKGVANLGGSRLSRYATLSGHVTLPAVAGTDSAESSVRIYDESGDLADVVDTDKSGAFSVKEVPGTYYVAAEGSRYSSFDETLYDADVSRVRFIRQYWAGKFSLASATAVRLGSGAKAALGFTLGRTLAATSAPAIVGTAKAGSTLRAATGTWNVRSGVAFSYQWKRNGVVVGRAATYAVTAADQGTALTLTVTAKDTSLEYVTGTATSKAVAVAKPVPPKKHKKKKHKKKHK